MNKEMWMKKAQEKGFSEFEIYQSRTRSREITWFQGQMDTFVTSAVTGTSIRGLADGVMVNMALESVDDEKADEVLESLLQQASIQQAKEKLNLVPPMETELVHNDKVWTAPEAPAIYAVMAELEKKILAYDPRMLQVNQLGWSEAAGSREITNTLGLSVEDQDQVQYIAASAVAKEGDDIKDGFLIRLVPDLKDFDADSFVKELNDDILGQLGAKPISSRKCPVILKNEAMTSLFAAFSGLFSGDLIAKGISPLRDELGKKIFADTITVIDDPRNTDALDVANFDDEGYPTREKVLVRDGVFESMLHSVKSAAKMNAEPTGNGFKSGFAGTVDVQPMNMYIQPGTQSLKQLEEQMGDGLVITDLAGLHAGLDFVSASFSLQASGYWVKDGKKEKPVTLITIAGNFLDLMKHAQAVGSDLDWKYHTIACPSILFTQIAVSGE